MLSQQQNVIYNLSKSLGVSQEIASLLFARGYDNYESAYKFLHPDINELTPVFAFNGMKEASELITHHIAKGSTIVVYGDYDCDGIGASAILYLAIKKLGGNAYTFIPSRQEDGYGLSFEALKRVIDLYNPNLIISVDCGISSPKEVEYAKSFGLDFIVTDHHEPQAIIPDCVVIDPKLQEGLPELCGAGVALRLVEAFAGKKEAMEYLDICAVSTIADLVPLVGDNRIIARYGLKKLEDFNVRYGFKALLSVSECKLGEPVDSYCIGYKIAPRLNASGRLSSAEKSLKLFISDDRTLVNLIAEELNAENKTRQALSQVIYSDALKMIADYDLNKRRIIVLYNENWESGVVGITASKIAQEFNRPTILITKKGDILRGSGRSIDGINLHDAISSAKDCLIQFGGHSMAAGLSILPENLEKFIDKVDDYLHNYTDDKDFLPSYKYDGILNPDKIDMPFMKELSMFEPYGMSNPKPVFMFETGKIAFSRLGGHNHIKYIGASGLSAIGFNFLWRLPALHEAMPKRLYFSLEKEVFRGRENVKAFLKDIELLNVNAEEDSLIECYFDKYIPIKAKQKIGEYHSMSDGFGHIVICFTMQSFLDASKKYPEYLKHFSNLPTLNPYNTILLAPDRDVDFSYYSKIEFVDKAPESYIDYLKKSFNAEIINGTNEPFFESLCSPSIDDLRETYVFIRRCTTQIRTYSSQEIYNTIKNLGYAFNFSKFIVYFLVLEELGLIAKDDTCSIYTVNKPSEPTNSVILNNCWKLWKKYSQN